jgi:hypothetical protein
MKNIIFLLILSFSMLANAAWRENERRIDTNLEVSYYNNIGSRFIKTQTNIIALKMGGIETLGVEPKRGPAEFFSVNHVDDYLAHIAKYMEWEAKASKNKDALTKEIGEAPTPMTGIRLKFGFHSGNANAHYLTIISCVKIFGSCSAEKQEPQYYAIEDAKELALLLTKLKNGEIKSGDVASEYQ